MFNNSIAIEQMASDINRERARNAKRNRMWQKARNAIRQRTGRGFLLWTYHGIRQRTGR